jgi:hypothetical protein
MFAGSSLAPFQEMIDYKMDESAEYLMGGVNWSQDEKIDAFRASMWGGCFPDALVRLSCLTSQSSGQAKKPDLPG